jgi:hypothetical protein
MLGFMAHIEPSKLGVINVKKFEAKIKWNWSPTLTILRDPTLLCSLIVRFLQVGGDFVTLK